MKELWISTNSYNLMKDNIEDRIIKAIRHDIKGVEIAFPSMSELMNYNPSNEIIEKLKKFKVSIEAPEIEYSEKNKEITQIIDKLKKLYEQLGAKYISFNLTEHFDSDFVLNNFNNFNLCVKNQSFKSDSIDDFDNQNKKYLNNLKLIIEKGFNLCFDICNIMSFDIEHISDFIYEFKNNIVKIHWSYLGNNIDHNAISIFKEEFNILLNIINSFETPLSIEIILRPNLPKRFIIQKELNFLKKNWLNKDKKTDIESNICFDLWTDKISNNYTPQRINTHLIKHFNEKEFGSLNWLASAENLINIYYKVKGLTEKDLEFVDEYKLIASEFKKITNISVKDKLVRLLVHYMKHTNESTPPPTQDLINLN